MAKPSRTLQQLNRALEGSNRKAGVTAQQIASRRCAYCGKAASEDLGVLTAYITWIARLITTAKIELKEPTSNWLHQPCVTRIKKIVNKW